MTAHVRSDGSSLSFGSSLRRAGAILAFGFAAIGCDTGLQPPGDWPDGGGGNPDGGSGLPCDVQQVLTGQCTSCHGNPVSGGAPIPLVTRADLAKKSTLDPNATYAQRSVVRMQAMTMPPAPATPATAADVKVLSDWIAAGMPAGSCDAKPDPLNAAPTCTSGTKWTLGNLESPDMHPGVACISCHTKMRAPGLLIGGTVYPTGHEPDDCNGASNDVNLADAVVEIKGADGTVIKLAVSGSSGNFHYLSRNHTLAKPYTAKVVMNGKERVMVAPQTNGDCNTCHTATGTDGAPGRITIPIQ